MADGFGNRPRILRGAFVEYGLAVPPSMVVFQFTRSSSPGTAASGSVSPSR